MLFRILLALLLVVGLGTFAYRALVLGYPLVPGGEAVAYDYEVQVDVAGEGGPARIGLYLPGEGNRYSPVREDFVSEGLGVTSLTDELGNRSVVWSTGALSGHTSVLYRGRLVERAGEATNAAADTPPDELPAERRLTLPADGARLTAATSLAAELSAEASDPATLVSFLFDRLNAPAGDEHAAALLPQDPGARDLARAAAEALGTLSIPARVVHGLPVAETETSITPSAFLEFWDRTAWRSFSVEGDPMDVGDFIVLWRGPLEQIATSGVTVRRTAQALARQDLPALAVLQDRREALGAGLALPALTDLSVNEQVVFQILLTIPAGVLVLVIARQVVGVPTFGTFMPVLIALAFRVTDLAWGLIFFSLLVLFGILARTVFARFNLLLVPRLAAMLIVVILIMAAITLVTNTVSVGLGLSVALFPLVVLTMTIERLTVMWEENGPEEALRAAAGSAAVATAAYLVMNFAPLEHLLFVFPELLLLILAATLLLGRYSGFRLSELYRFRRLAREA